MHPSFVLAAALAFAQAMFGAPPSATPATAASFSPQQYATVMASMSPCGLSIDMAKAGTMLQEAGVASNQEKSEEIGKLVWEEGQRIYQMTTAEQASHCAEMRSMVVRLGLQ